MSFKKILILASTLFLIFFGLIPNNTTASGVSQLNNQTSLESFSTENLEEHPDVKEYILKNGFGSYLNTEDQADSNILNSLSLSSVQSQSKVRVSGVNFSTYGSISNEDTEPGEFTEEEEAEIVKKYGLTKPEPYVKENIQNILVERKLSIGVPDKVWLLNYIHTDAGITVTVVNVGGTPLDRISGTLKKYNKSRDTWRLAATHPFSKVSVNSGIVHTWLTGRQAVSDYFEYKVNVTRNGAVYSYDNIGKMDHQRYLFSAGPYNKMSALGGERHHFVSDKSLAITGFKAASAPAIRMMYRDHLNTPSWGSGAAAKAYRENEQQLLKNKQYEDVIRLEISGLRNAADSEGKVINLEQKYYSEVVSAILLTEKYFGIR